MSICTECKKRNSCTELCEKAEEHANQDYVDWGATPTTYQDPSSEELRVFDPVKGIDKPYLSKREKAVLSRLGSGMTRHEIAEDLSLSRVNLRAICSRLRKKALQLIP